MTREAAIRILGQYDVNFYWTDGQPIPAAEIAAAVELAIEALGAADAEVAAERVAASMGINSDTERRMG